MAYNSDKNNNKIQFIHLIINANLLKTRLWYQILNTSSISYFLNSTAKIITKKSSEKFMMTVGNKEHKINYKQYDK